MTLPSSLVDQLSIPVMAAPLFICSGPELVVEQCKAGILGSFPALNARPASMLGDWLSQIEETLAAHSVSHPRAKVAPFAVNQIVHRSNDRLEQDIQSCVDHRVPVVITSLGARTEVYDAIHSYGGVVFHDVISNAFAHKAIEKGADGLIAVAAGAGGHAGTISPFALIQEIRSWFDGPLLLSGAIASGRSILAARALGADLAYIGSPFLSTTEANNPVAYKQMIVDSSSADIVYSNRFTGVHGNYLRGSIIASGLDPENLGSADPSAMDWGANEDPAVKPWKDIWGSGQGVGAIEAVLPVRELVERWTREYCDARGLLLAGS